MLKHIDKMKGTTFMIMKIESPSEQRMEDSFSYIKRDTIISRTAPNRRPEK